MQRWTGLGVGIAATILSSGLLAFGPEGGGDVSAALAWAPMVAEGSGVVAGGATAQGALELPLVSAAALHLDASVLDRFSASGGQDTRILGGGGEIWIDLFTAQCVGRDFVCGLGANPDGNLFWPKLTFGYDASAQQADSSGKKATSRYEYLDYRVALPLVACLSLEADYSKGFSRDLSTEDVFGSDDNGAEREGATLVFYGDAVAGAGADTSRPYLPHYGRPGQYRVSVAWEREAQDALTPTNTYTFSVGAPLGASWAAALNFAQANTDPLAERSLGISGQWAFGAPEQRVR
jgi:hypothetical protein